MMALMRKLIRNNYIYRVLLWGFLIMMAVGGGLAVNWGQEKKWIIKVYDEFLTENKFHLMLKSARKQQEDFRQRGIQLAGKNIEKDTASSAVSGLLVEHIMHTLSLTVPDTLVEQGMQKHLGELPSYFFKSGELDLEVFKKYIAPYTIEDFIEDIYSEKKNKLFFDIVDLAIYSPEFELALQYNTDYASKSYSILTLPVQKFITDVKKNPVTQDTLEKFYKKAKNNEEFKTVEQRAGVVWSFDQDGYGIVVSEGDVKSFYDKNKQKYLLSPSEVQVRLLLLKVEPGKEAEVKKKIEGLHEQAEKNPLEFEKLVKDFSQDESLASKGGLTDFFAQDTKRFDQVIVKTAFESLSKNDQISSPIKTDRGYELVQLVKRNPAKYKELKSVEAEIKKDLISAKFKQRFKQDATRIINQAKYNPDILSSFIKKHGGKKSTIDMDVKKPGSMGMHLFKTGEQKYTTFFDKGNGILLYCSEVQSSKVPPLNNVKDKVEEKYYTQEAKLQLEKALLDMSKEAKNSDFQDLAKKYGVSVKSATCEHKKDGSVDQSPILKEPEVQSKVKTLHTAGATTYVMTDAEGLLIQLDSLGSRDAELFSAQKDKLSKTMFYAKKYQVKEGFIASLYRRAKLNNKIHLKDEVLQLIKESK